MTDPAYSDDYRRGWDAREEEVQRLKEKYERLLEAVKRMFEVGIGIDRQSVNPHYIHAHIDAVDKLAKAVHEAEEKP